MSAMLSVRIDEKLMAQLEALARATRRSRSYLAAQALEQYVSVQSWQVAEIVAGLRDVEAGRTIPHREVEKELIAWEEELESGQRTRKRAS